MKPETDCQGKHSNLAKSLGDGEAFTITIELAPPDKDSTTPPEKQLLEAACKLKAEKRLQAFAFGERHTQQLSLLECGRQFLQCGLEPLLYYSLQGKDRDTVAQDFRQFASLEVPNILIVSGDYPKARQGQNVLFDLDSVQAQMPMHNRAKSALVDRAGPAPSTSLYTGCVVSPYKGETEEQVGQYVKLSKKVEAGAKFVITQVGYDLEQLKKFRQFCRQEHPGLPILVNLFLPGRHMLSTLQQGKLAGVHLSDFELQELGSGALDDPAVFQWTARWIATLRRLGFTGVHLGGPGLDHKQLSPLLDRAEAEYVNWSKSSRENAGSLTKGPTSPEVPQASPQHGGLPQMRIKFPLYSFSWFVDQMVYLPHGPLYPLMKKLCRWADNHRWLANLLFWLEKATKWPLYGCRMCGDCTLYSSSFVCMESTCPKRQLNGPCGGSINGYCEVFPGQKRCRWVVAFRQCPDNSYAALNKAPALEPKRQQLNNTCSWINFFCGRDHRKMKD